MRTGWVIFQLERDTFDNSLLQTASVLRGTNDNMTPTGQMEIIFLLAQRNDLQNSNKIQEDMSTVKQGYSINKRHQGEMK